MKTAVKYSPEVKERAVRLVLERQHEHDSHMDGNQFDRAEERLCRRNTAPVDSPGRA